MNTEKLPAANKSISYDTTKSNGTPRSESFFILKTFQKNTSLLIACVSAIVALFSFATNFFAERITITYLAYWNIDSTFAFGSSNIFIHSLVCSLVYIVALAITHALMSTTADTFKHYYKAISLINFQKNSERRLRKEFKREYRKTEKLINRTLEMLDDHQKEGPWAEETSRKMMDMQNEMAAIQGGCYNSESILWYKCWLYLNAAVTIILTFVIVSFSLLIAKNSITLPIAINVVALSLILILFDTLLYFGTAMYRARVTPKIYESMDISSYMDELKKIGDHQFPLSSLTSKAGIKRIFSDKNFKLLFFQFALVAMMFVASTVFLGQTMATQKKQFPIYTDNANTYAIIHINNEHYIMLDARIDGNAITINTAKQRILKTDDISYDLTTFQNVTKVETGGDIP